MDQFLQLQSQALYTNNASSAVISYVGKLKGYRYVAEAAHDPEIERLLDQAYREIETGLIKQLHVFQRINRSLPGEQKKNIRILELKIRWSATREIRFESWLRTKG